MSDRHETLDGMIDSLRAVTRSDEAQLSDAARETVRRRIRQGRRRPELSPLFTPFSHWAYAAGIPAATALLLAATFMLQAPEPGMIAQADRQTAERSSDLQGRRPGGVRRKRGHRRRALEHPGFLGWHIAVRKRRTFR